MKELFRACWVIARRDYSAIVFSKAFFFFLLGPLFPLVVGVMSAQVGKQVAAELMQPRMGVIMSDADSAKIGKAAPRLQGDLGDVRLPLMIVTNEKMQRDQHVTPQSLLANKTDNYVIVLSGTLDKPVLTGRQSEVTDLKPRIALLVSAARAGPALTDVEIDTQYVAETRGAEQRVQLTTARLAQTVLLLLTMLLAGMVLSNLVEEKTNKVIEILTSAVPVDAIFVGKLFAMLAMALTGIAVWATVGLVGVTIWGGTLPQIPAPAIGWPTFIVLGIAYFSTAYLLLGGLFLGIGAQASTVRGANPFHAHHHGTDADLCAGQPGDRQNWDATLVRDCGVSVQLALYDDVLCGVG